MIRTQTYPGPYDVTCRSNEGNMNSQFRAWHVRALRPIPAKAKPNTYKPRKVQAATKLCKVCRYKFFQDGLSPGILPETRWRKLESEAPPGLPARNSAWAMLALVQLRATSRPRSMQSHFPDHPMQTQLEQAPEEGAMLQKCNGL